MDLQQPPYTTDVFLADGGVYDNLGLETAWKRYRTVLDLGRRRPRRRAAEGEARLGPPAAARARRDRQPGPGAAQAPGDRRVQARRPRRAPTGGSAPTSPTTGYPTRSRARRRRRCVLARTATRLKSMDRVLQERLDQLGLRGQRCGHAPARRSGRQPARRLPLSRRRGSDDGRAGCPPAPAPPAGEPAAAVGNPAASTSRRTPTSSSTRSSGARSGSSSPPGPTSTVGAGSGSADRRGCSAPTGMPCEPFLAEHRRGRPRSRAHFESATHSQSA